jgi:uncharacterized membrane protein YraQ (UPF0718 family)
MLEKFDAFLPELLKVYLELAPYLFIGLAFVGILHLLIKDDWIGKQLGNNKFSAVLKAALIGVPMPLCSCGVIPTALHINKKGASKGATVSFLISTPQTGIDSITPTIGMLGPVFGIFRPLWAFLSGIVGGLATNLFVNNSNETFEDKEIKSCCSSGSCSTEIPQKKTVKELFRYAFVEFLDDISPQLVVGIVLFPNIWAGFHRYVPDYSIRTSSICMCYRLDSDCNLTHAEGILSRCSLCLSYSRTCHQYCHNLHGYEGIRCKGNAYLSYIYYSNGTSGRICPQ